MKTLICVCLLAIAGNAFCADDWYVYRSLTGNGQRVEVVEDGISKPMYKCYKAAYSPGFVAAYNEKNGVPYRLTEQMTKKGQPLVVDIQYEQLGAAETVLLITTDRFVRGKQLCEQIRSEDVAGTLSRRLLSRYK